MNTACFKETFRVGQTDFRNTAKFQTQNYLVLTFSSLLVASIAPKVCVLVSRGVKFRPNPFLNSPRCIETARQADTRTPGQVCHLLGSLLHRAKGRDRPTPRIVLDILGV